MRYYRTYKEYRNAWKDAIWRDPPIPLNIDIELSAVCNLKCPFCFMQDPVYKENKSLGQMPLPTALHIIRECKRIGIPSIKLNWRGEPTIYQHFTKVLQAASRGQYFYDIIVNTNGNCPDDSIKGLMKCTKVIFSVDALDKNIYAKMRKNGDIRTVINTINSLLDRGHNGITIRRIITKENKNEKDFKEIVENTFNHEIQVSEHYCFDRNTQEKYQSSISRQPTLKNRVYCGYPSQRLVIATNGDVFPCCVDYHGKFKLGNIYNDNLMDIWQSPKLSELRKILRQKMHHVLDLCRNCTSWMSYKCKERRNVKK